MNRALIALGIFLSGASPAWSAANAAPDELPIVPASSTTEIALTPVATGGAKLNRLSALIDRYIAWRGGEAFERLQSVHITAIGSLGTATATTQRWTTKRERTRLQLEVAGATFIWVVTPQTDWQSSRNGQFTVGADNVRTARLVGPLQFADAFRGGGAKATLANKAEWWQGEWWSVVHMAPDDSSSFDVFINGKTGRLGGYRLWQAGKRRDVRFDDWRKVGGDRMPFAETTQDEGAPPSISRVMAVELNPMLDETLFERPTDAREAFLKPGVTSTGWINFEFYNDQQIFLPIKLNGHEVVALLDSGAGSSVIDQAYAASLGLEHAEATVVHGSAGDVDAYFVRGNQIEIGDLTLKDPKLVSLNLPAVTRNGEHPIPFVLGADVFNELVVDIDFAHHRLALADPAGFSVPRDAVEVSLVKDADLHLVPISIKGHPSSLFNFDLGHSGTIDIAPKYTQQQKLLDGRRSTLISGGLAAGGTFVFRRATLSDVEFAGVHFGQIPADFRLTWPAASFSDRVSGNIGIGILSRFRLIVDYPHNRLYAIANPDAGIMPFAKDLAGLVVLKNAYGYTVSEIRPGSPAEVAGVNIGDRIISINGKPIDSTSIQLINAAPIGTKISLTISSGVTKIVELANYY